MLEPPNKCYFCAVKTCYILLGSVSLALGVVGIFVPLLPTTPFLLLAALCWVHASPRLYAWLLAQPRLGAYIRNYRENRAMPLRAKVWTLVLMWASMLWCICEPLAGLWWAQVGLALVGAGVTVHLAMLSPSRRNGRKSE